MGFSLIKPSVRLFICASVHPFNFVCFVSFSDDELQAFYCLLFVYAVKRVVLVHVFVVMVVVDISSKA